MNKLKIIVLLLILSPLVVVAQVFDCLNARKKYVAMYPEVREFLSFTENAWDHYNNKGKYEGKVWDCNSCLNFKDTNIVAGNQNEFILKNDSLVIIRDSEQNQVLKLGIKLDYEDTLIKELLISRFIWTEREELEKKVNLLVTNEVLNFMGELYYNTMNNGEIITISYDKWQPFQKYIAGLGSKDDLDLSRNNHLKIPIVFIHFKNEDKYYFVEPEYGDINETDLVELNNKKVEKFFKKNNEVINILENEARKKEVLLTYTGINDLDEYQYVIEKSRIKSGTFHDIMIERNKKYSFWLNESYAYWGPKNEQGKPNGNGYIVQCNYDGRIFIPIRIVAYAKWSNGFIDSLKSYFIYENMPTLKFQFKKQYDNDVNLFNYMFWITHDSSNNTAFYLGGESEGIPSSMPMDGIIIFKNTIHYGEYYKGKKFSFGYQIWSSGHQYIGEYQENNLSGHGGIMYYPDGYHYEGSWENGKRNGFGKLYDTQNKLIKDGQWVNDTFTKTREQVEKEEQQEREREIFNQSLLSGRYDNLIEDKCYENLIKEVANLYITTGSGEIKDVNPIFNNAMNDVSIQIGHELTKDEKIYFKEVGNKYFKRLNSTMGMLNTPSKSSNTKSNSEWKYKCMHPKCNNTVNQEGTVYYWEKKGVYKECDSESLSNGVGTMYYGAAGKGYCSSKCAVDDCYHYTGSRTRSQGMISF